MTFSFLLSAKTKVIVPVLVFQLAQCFPWTNCRPHKRLQPLLSHETSTIRLLEHININAPSHEHIVPFFFDVLGCGLDPRRNNIGSPGKTLWANCGASQFHLPYGDVAQRIPGHIGLRFHTLEKVKQRLTQHPTCYQSWELVRPATPQEFLKIVDMYGNEYRCRAGESRVDSSLNQPTVKSKNDCLGIDYVEFKCSTGTAEYIAQFYESVFDADTSVVEDANGKVAIVAIGRIVDGHADQSLLFRETEEPISVYDGHHIAIYVGETSRDFDQAYKNAEIAGIVWVNPRFSDKADSLAAAREYRQFRFKQIINIEQGDGILDLEHEVRSIEHGSWPRCNP